MVHTDPYEAPQSESESHKSKQLAGNRWAWFGMSGIAFAIGEYFAPISHDNPLVMLVSATGFLIGLYCLYETIRRCVATR